MSELRAALWIYRACLTLAVVFAVLVVCIEKAKPQDQQSLKDWFNKLSSPAGGICCHNFDGASLDEDQWRVVGGHYEVFVNGLWMTVPDPNLVTVPNRLGRAHLWMRADGTVRCFMPGALG